jgi:hypothetical protein
MPKKGLATIQVFKEIERCQADSISPALPDTGPPSTAGFVFLDGLFLRGRRSAGEFGSWP